MYSNHLLLVGRTEVPSGKPFYNYSLPLFFFNKAPCWLVESLNVFFEEWDKTSPVSTVQKCIGLLSPNSQFFQRGGNYTYC